MDKERKSGLLGRKGLINKEEGMRRSSEMSR